MRLTPILVSLVLLAGCSSAPAQVITVTASASSTASPSPVPSVNGWDNAQAFADAALSGDYEKAEKFASPNSAAARYLIHMRAVDDAMIGGGGSSVQAPDDVTYDADSQTVTYTYTDGPTTDWTDFQYDADGYVVSWATGKSSTTLSERLWTKSAKVANKHVSIELVSAYKNDSALWVVLDIKAKDRSIEPDWSPLLDDVKGRQREAGEVDGPDKIMKGNRAYVAYAFGNADFGGTLRYKLEDTAYNDLGTLKIKIK